MGPRVTITHVTSARLMPVAVGVQLGCAALQVVADDAGVDLLHIKGPSVHLELLATLPWVDPVTGSPGRQGVARRSIDIDVLVRPSHVDRLFAAMAAHRWVLAYRFEDGSAFEHASTWLREGLAAADVHRTFPGFGIDHEVAFDRLWADRQAMDIGGYLCEVPSLTAQRLSLILHATRGGDLGGGDIHRAWTLATPHDRAEVDALAAELGATVALAAGTGRLDQHRDAREYDLWRVLSTGNHSRIALWKARVRAQPTAWGRVRTAVKLAGPKPGRLRHVLGRDPTPIEVGRAWGKDVLTVAAEVGRRLTGRLRSRA